MIWKINSNVTLISYGFVRKNDAIFSLCLVLLVEVFLPVVPYFITSSGISIFSYKKNIKERKWIKIQTNTFNQLVFQVLIPNVQEENTLSLLFSKECFPPWVYKLSKEGLQGFHHCTRSIYYVLIPTNINTILPHYLDEILLNVLLITENRIPLVHFV